MDLEDFHTCWQPLLPLSNDTRLQMIRGRLLSKLTWSKEKVFFENRQETARKVMWWILVALTLRRVAPRKKKKLRKYSAQCCTTVPEMISNSGPGLIVDCKDPHLQEWVLQLNTTRHTKGCTMKVEQRRPRWKPQDIYALAH